MNDMLRGLPSHLARTGQTNPDPVDAVVGALFPGRTAADLPPKPTDRTVSLPLVTADRLRTWTDLLHECESAVLAEHLTRELVTETVESAVSVARSAIEALEDLQDAIRGAS